MTVTSATGPARLPLTMVTFVEMSASVLDGMT